jgi:hypothetical protein
MGGMAIRATVSSFAALHVADGTEMDVGAGANVLSFGRFQNAEGFATVFA